MTARVVRIGCTAVEVTSLLTYLDEQGGENWQRR